MKIINLIFSLAYSIVLLVIFIFVGLIILNYSDSVFAKMGFFAVIGIGSWGAWWLFRAGNKSGIYNLYIESKISHELDESMHRNDPNVKLGTIEQWLDDLKLANISFEGGYISIWGYKRDHDLDTFNEFHKYKYRPSGKLTLYFKNGNRLYLDGIGKIYYSKTYAKFMKVSKIKWMWNHGKNYIAFTFDGHIIKTNSNLNEKFGSLDLHYQAAPVMIWRNV